MKELREIANLQESYRKFKERNLTKKSLCKLIIVFRDKYKLTDEEAIMITKGEISLLRIANLLDSGIPENDDSNPRQGRWKSTSTRGEFICSCCNHVVMFDLSRYCPECGTKMED